VTVVIAAVVAVIRIAAVVVIVARSAFLTGPYASVAQAVAGGLQPLGGAIGIVVLVVIRSGCRSTKGWATGFATATGAVILLLLQRLINENAGRIGTLLGGRSAFSR
jgi:zinc transporter ZupT